MKITLEKPFLQHEDGTYCKQIKYQNCIWDITKIGKSLGKNSFGIEELECEIEINLEKEGKIKTKK